MTFVGIDVSKTALEVALLAATGEVERRKYPNTPPGHDALLDFLDGQLDPRVTLEATGSYHQRLTLALQAAGVHVSVVNPAQASYFVKSQHRRNKTDRADALSLAMYGRERLPVATAALTPTMQSLTRELRALSEDLARLKNRLEAAENGVAHAEVLGSLKRRIEAIEAEKRLLEERLEKETKENRPQEVALLTSIPCVAVKTASWFLAEVGTIDRFASAAKLVAFAGLNPAIVESGASVDRRSRISRLGSSILRYMLYLPTLAGLRYNPILKAYYERLVAKGKPKKSAVVACMAKLLRIMYGVLIHRRSFDASYVAA